MSGLQHLWNYPEDEERPAGSTAVHPDHLVGRLGATELAAVGFGGIWMWTTFCFFIGTSSGVQTFVSQHHGAGQPERCGAWV